MRFKHGQVNQPRLAQYTWDAEGAQALRAFGPQFNPILFASLRVYTQDTNAVFRAELLDPQDGIGGLAVELGAGCFTQHRLCSTGAHFFGNRFEQRETGDLTSVSAAASHEIWL